jgi:hypothetical protein
MVEGVRATGDVSWGLRGTLVAACGFEALSRGEGLGVGMYEIGAGLVQPGKPPGPRCARPGGKSLQAAEQGAVHRQWDLVVRKALKIDESVAM